MKGSVCFFTIVWWQYIHTENQFKMKNFLAKTKISLISVKTLKWTRLEMWWVGVQDRNLDRPRIPAPLVKIRPYQGWGLRCKVSHPDAICSSCHHAEAREAESWQGEFQHFFFFFFFWDIHVNFSVRGKKTSYFSWMLSIHFGANKMASLAVQKDVKIFHWKPAVAAGQWFLLIQSKYSYSFLCLEESP